MERENNLICEKYVGIFYLILKEFFKIRLVYLEF